MTDAEKERWRAAVRWHRELLEKVAADLEQLALQTGRPERDSTALKRRAARIRQHLFQRDRDPFVPV